MPFTPYIADDAEGPFDGLILWDRHPSGAVRIHAELTDEDRRLFDALPNERGQQPANPPEVRVTDQQTGIAFYVRRADCGLGCHCAAEITTIASNPIVVQRIKAREKAAA